MAHQSVLGDIQDADLDCTLANQLCHLLSACHTCAHALQDRAMFESMQMAANQVECSSNTQHMHHQAQCQNLNSTHGTQWRRVECVHAAATCASTPFAATWLCVHAKQLAAVWQQVAGLEDNVV